jgi:hypothetical protein
MSLSLFPNLTRHFKILKRREGPGGAFRDLFSEDDRTVEGGFGQKA